MGDILTNILGIYILKFIALIKSYLSSKSKSSVFRGGLRPTEGFRPLLGEWSDYVDYII